MATITLDPSDRDLVPQTFAWGLQWDVQINIFRSGAVRTRTMPGARYMVDMAWGEKPLQASRIVGKREALIASLRGGANLLALPRFDRLRPNGTLRGTPTIASAVAAGAVVLPLANCNGGLQRGDLIKANGQVFTALADCNPSAGNMTVSVEPGARGPITAGTAALWDAPTALFIPTGQSYSQASRPGAFEMLSLQLMEVWQ